MKKNSSRHHQKIQVHFRDESKVHPALKEYFGYCLFKVSARFRSLMDSELAEHQLQTHHLGILKVLEKSGATSQIQLGEDLGIDKASMVKLVDHLEAKGLVVRETSQQDRRIKYIHMTAAGVKKLHFCHNIKEKAEKKLFQSTSAADQKKFRALVLQLLLEE